MSELAQTPQTGDRRAYVLECAIMAVALLYVLSGLGAPVLGDSAGSRLATVYSLVHDGTWFIDRPLDEPPNPFEGYTIDKVELDGRLLSTKPPVLPLAMTAEYLALHKILGWDLREQGDWKRIVQAMIASLAAIPFIIGVYFFALLLRLLIANPWRRMFPLAALALGTQLPGFATELNNHSPAVAALIATLYLSIGLCSGKLAPAWHRFAGFGLASALVFTLDMPLTIFPAVAGMALLWKFPKPALIWGGSGALPLLALHFGAMLWVTGSPLPIQMHKDLYLYEASAWRIPGQIDALNEPKGTYFFHMTFGRFGIFLLYPILLLGLLGCLQALQREWAPWRIYYAAGLFCIGLLFFYYVQGTNNYGGAAYGFRWGMGMMPVLLLMGIPVFERMRRPWAWGLALVLLAVSIYSGWECYRVPWGDCHEWTCRWIFGVPYRV